MTEHGLSRRCFLVTAGAAGGARRMAYGELVELAGTVTPPGPDGVHLKPAQAFRLIGRAIRRLDAPDKVTGRQVYGIDLRLTGMLYASVARCPVVGGTLRHLNDSGALAVPGVRRVVRLEADPRSRLPERVAVIADSTWAALQGRRTLVVDWDEGRHASLSSAAIRRQLIELDAAAPVVVRNDGDVIAAGIAGPRATEATYEVPYLAHAAVEPITAPRRCGRAGSRSGLRPSSPSGRWST